MGRIALSTILSALLLLKVYLGAYAQQQINRNTDDCINPALTTGDWGIWPNSKYMISGTGFSRDSGGNIVITNRANFRVTYYKSYKIVENFSAKETYVLYQCGTNPPTNYPAGAKLFQIPLSSISADDTSAAEFAKECGAVDRVAYVSEFICSSCMQALAVCGYTAPNPSYQQQAAADIQNQVDAFFTFSASSNPKSIAMSAVTQDSPLSRAEWLKYVSVFFNKEWEAEALFRTIRTAYNDLKRAAQARSAAINRKPLVLWVYKGFDSDFVVSKPLYKVAYVEDAGGQMLADSKLQALGFVSKTAGSWSIPQARSDVWKNTLKLADIIITEDYEMATAGYVRMKQFTDAHGLPSSNSGVPAVNKGEVYSIAGVVGQTITAPDSDNKGSVGTDWFEGATSRCEQVLRDFVKVITPSTSNPAMNGWSRRWLLRLSDATQKQIKIGLICDNDTAKLDSKCVRTSKYPASICPNTIRNCDPKLDASQLGCMLYPKQSDRCTVLGQQKKIMRQLAANGQTCAVTTPTKLCA